jgi:hypothetical protein
LAAGQYTVNVTDDNGDAGSATITVSAGGSSSATVSLVAQATVTGTVTDSSANRISGATVVFQLSTNLQQITSAITADDGAYSLVGLAPGTYDVTVFADGYLASTQQGVVVSNNVSLDASLTQSDTTTNGSLADPSGNPVPSGWVAISDEAGHILGTAQVNPNGAFTLTSAQGSNLVLQVVAKGYAPATVSVNVPAGVTTQLNPVVLQAVAIDPTPSGSPNAPSQGPIAPDGQAWADQIAGLVQSVDPPGPPVPPKCPTCMAAYNNALAQYSIVKSDAETVNTLVVKTRLQAINVDADLINAQSELTKLASLQGIVSEVLFIVGIGSSLSVKLLGPIIATLKQTIDTFETYNDLVGKDYNNLARAGSPGRIKTAAIAANADVNAAILSCGALLTLLPRFGGIDAFLNKLVIKTLNRLTIVLQGPDHLMWLQQIVDDANKLDGLYHEWLNAYAEYEHALADYDAALAALAACEAQPCTLVTTVTSYTDCGGNQVTSEAAATTTVSGCCTTPQEVENSLHGTLGSSTNFGIGVGGGASGGGGVAPAVASSCNCNPEENNENSQDQKTQQDAGDPPVNTAPLVAGTTSAANALGAPGTTSPLSFIATAFGNLGLINGQSGNSGDSPADLAQIASTIATFDQVESDLAGMFATAAAPGGTVDIAGDINLLQQVDGRLQAVTSAENTLFGGDANWLSSREPLTLQQWLTAFYADAQDSSDGGESITDAERAQLLALTLPSTVSTDEANEFLDRWNRTVQYWGQGILTAAQVPPGQSTDFLDVSALQTAFNAAQTAEQFSQVNGYSDPLAETRAALVTVHNDLQQHGVCATVRLQIDQTATLSRSAFSGTLSITNGEEAGDLTNVVVNVNITDTNGNPANGEFFVSGPTYGGAFNVVDGSATLPVNTTGTIAFTFIPNDSAAASAPTQYDIGGAVSFTDPSTGATVTAPVFPAIITVYPQAKLQLNYFLQRDVIGDDPFTPQIEPSEPAVLGLLVTNTGLGSANNLSITTAQPQIIDNEKGLLNTFQIIGTQVGAQQETPSLAVNFGNVAPGQTADADFLLVSTLQGILFNFTATFTHSDALGGLDTSLIQSVNTHTLIHAGNFNFPNSTGAIDYLAEDNANPQNLPDTIYFSDGTAAPVNIAADAQSVAGSSANTYTVTANVTSGWDYIELPDPGAGYTLSQVIRSDGTVIPVSDQAWTTDRTFNAAGNSTLDPELHILDFDSTGSYTVVYVPKTTTVPTIVSLQSVNPNPTNQAVSSLQVVFSEPINPSTLTLNNLNLVEYNGNNASPNLISSAVTIAQLSGSTYQINGLDALDGTNGSYVLTVSAAGVQDLQGNFGGGSASTSWTVDSSVTPPLPASNVAVTPGTSTAATDFVTNSTSVTITGTLGAANERVDLYDVTQSQDLGTATVTDTSFSENVSGLAAGSQTIRIRVSDSAGNYTDSTINVFVDVTPPVVSSITNVPAQPTNTPVASVEVTFAEPINPATFDDSALALTLDGGPNLITSAVTITSLSDSTYLVSGLDGLTQAEGTYVLTVSTTGIQDQGGNYGIASGSPSWLMDTTPPASTVAALPAIETQNAFVVSWSGQDNSGGSGIAYYDIYVQEDGAAFMLWQSQTTETSATYVGATGHGYGFYSIATDIAGNTEPTPSQAEATTVDQGPIATSISLTSSAAAGSTYGDTVTFAATVNPVQSFGSAPTGNLQFLVDGSSYGGLFSVSDGTATITVSGLTAGSHTITATYSGDVNYQASNNALSQSVSPAPLTITADDQSKAYGDPLPDLTSSYSGFVNGDTSASLTTLPTLSTTATATSDVLVGGYPIAAAGASDPNYTISYVSGTLTITPADQTINWSDPTPILYGTPLGGTQLDATVTVIGPAPAGTLTYNPPAGTVLSSGVQTLTVTAAATTDYNVATANVSITVVAPVTISGRAFDDLSGSGQDLPSDPALPGWSISLYDANGNPVDKSVTDASGNYSFTQWPGTYTVAESLPTGWLETYPTGSGAFTLTLAEGQSSTANDFGNFQLVSIGGQVFNDLNGDGVRQINEPSLQGVEVDLMDNQGNVLKATSDANGNYSFSNVGPGTFTLSQVLPSGAVQTASPAVNPVTTNSGGNVGSELFGDFFEVSIAGTVFNDLNGDGIRQNNEPGLQGVEIDLTDSHGNVTKATSDANGNYSFSNLGPGAFGLTQLVPAGAVQTATPATNPVTTSSGSNVSGELFGEFFEATISGMVFNDLNGDGVRQNNEPGLSGVEVDLTDSHGNVTKATSDANGNYSFSNLAPGTFTLSQVVPAGAVQTATPAVNPVTTSSGSNVSGELFGDFLKVTISGTVFNDLNGDGIRQNNEPGLQGVEVDLTDSHGNVTKATSDANGNYNFANLGAGTFTLSQVVQSGWLQTATPAVNPVSASSGSNVGSELFGNFQTVTISGEVFNDLDGSGVFKNGDPGLQGVEVDLTDSHGNVTKATSDANGNYSFANLGPGTFTLSQVAPQGFTQTATPAINPVTTSSGTNVPSELFGDHQQNGGPQISGRVFNDIPGSGVDQQSDPGLQGWTVEVVSGNTVVASTTSASDGTYQFSNIAAGTYTVEEVLQSGFVQTFPSSQTYSVTLTGNNSFSGEDFGDFQTVTISGTVFNDLNGDGVRQNNEPGLSGVEVDLTDSHGNVTKATSDANGNYSFANLAPGTFTLSQVVPVGAVQTATPAVNPVTTSSGSNVGSELFGDFFTVTISGTVFNDLNGDGVRQNNEPGLSGVEVDLTDSHGNVTKTTSDANGNYSFSNLGPGTFTLSEVVQSGWLQTATPAVNPVTTSSGANVATEFFGNFQTVTISGAVFNDLNGDGIRQNNEPGLQGWEVDLTDSHGNVTKATSDANGNYSFSNLGPGTFTLSGIAQSGWVHTATPAVNPVITSSGANVASELFGNFQTVTISGTVFNDLNDDHIQDNGEPGIPNVVVNLSNGLSATTDANGNYSISGVGPGTFTLGESVPSTYIETSPSGDAYSLTPTSGANIGSQIFADAAPVLTQGAVPGFSGYYETGTGWTVLPGGWSDHGKTQMHAASSTAATANWSLTKRGGLPAAKYEIFLTYVSGTGRATNASYTISDNGKLLKTEALNQTQAPSGGTYQGFAWTSLGVFTINNGRINITLSDNPSGSVDADGMLILSAGTSSTPQTLLWPGFLPFALGAKITVGTTASAMQQVVTALSMPPSPPEAVVPPAASADIGSGLRIGVLARTQQPGSGTAPGVADALFEGTATAGRDLPIDFISAAAWARHASKWSTADSSNTIFGGI